MTCSSITDHLNTLVGAALHERGIVGFVATASASTMIGGVRKALWVHATTELLVSTAVTTLVVVAATTSAAHKKRISLRDNALSLSELYYTLSFH